jgi:fructose-bisphosphate aldolase class II
VPQDLLAIINQYGGKMKETYGVPVEEIQEAIKFGVRKINIDTDIRLAMTGAVRKFLAENPDKFDAREWLKPAREAAKQICKQRYIEFGCEGQGGKIKGDSLQVVARSTQGRAGPGGEVKAPAPGNPCPGWAFMGTVDCSTGPAFSFFRTS